MFPCETSSKELDNDIQMLCFVAVILVLCIEVHVKHVISVYCNVFPYAVTEEYVGLVTSETCKEGRYKDCEFPPSWTILGSNMV